MMLLALAAVLPGVFWEGAPSKAPALRESGVHHIFVAPDQVEAWKKVEDIVAEAVDLNLSMKLKSPAVNYRFEQASASRVPWIDGNGWQFLRRPDGRYYYDAAGERAAIAAAEAFAWHARANVKTDDAGLPSLARMLAFLRALPDGEGQPVADIGFADDGSAVAGEVMNLLVRGNLLFRVTQAPDPKLKLNVKLGAARYPVEQARNPATMAQMIRADLRDEARSLRIYGSAVVIGRLERAGNSARVHLLNYDVNRKVNGVRVRVAGEFKNGQLAVADLPAGKLLDLAATAGATEFTVPELKSYAVIDLTP
jgi:hypothetical protein